MVWVSATGVLKDTRIDLWSLGKLEHKWQFLVRVPEMSEVNAEAA